MKNILKKTIITLFLIFLIPSLFAKPSSSANIPLDSSFYEDFDTLMTSIGRNANRTRPYTYAEANLYLDQIDNIVFNEAEKALYESLRAEVETDSYENNKIMSFDYAFTFNPELYFHTNLNFKDRVDFLMLTADKYPDYSYSNEDKYMTWDRDKNHIFDIDLSLSFKDTVTLLFRAPIANTVHTGFPSGSSYLMSNIPFLASLTSFSSNSIQDFSMNFPYRAHISIGGSWYSIMVGRERLEFGSGETGNMVIDSSLPYHNALSLSFFTPSFKYNFLLSFFPYPDQFITGVDEAAGEYKTDLIFDQNSDAFSGIKMFMAHRFDFSFLNGAHRIAITEGIMYQSEKGILDLQVLNPMMFFHNMYIAGNSNSILQLEYDFAIVRGINQHIAIAIDDLNIPFEDQDGSEQRPNAIGLQLGLRTSHAIAKGFLESNAEITYMSPYFYLRDGKAASSLPLDFVIAIRNQRSGAGIYDLYSIGYPNGGDQVILHLNASYRVIKSYKVKTSVEYRAFGKNNLMTVYMKGSEDGVYTHMLGLSLEGEYYFTDNMLASAKINDKMFFNYNNESGNFQNDFCLTLSYKYTV